MNIKENIVEIIERLLCDWDVPQKVCLSDTFYNLNFDDLDRVELLMDLERRFDILIPYQFEHKMETVQQLVDCVIQLVGSEEFEIKEVKEEFFIKTKKAIIFKPSELVELLENKQVRKMFFKSFKSDIEDIYNKGVFVLILVLMSQLSTQSLKNGLIKNLKN